MNKLPLLFLLFSLPIYTSPLNASNNEQSDVKESIHKAMNSTLRTEADKMRDKNRKPLETLMFFGLKEDMKVIELIPGSGWYTKILAPVLADNGDFSIALGTARVSSNLLGKEGMEFINLIEPSANIRHMKDSTFNTVDNFELSEADVDMIFTFRNYHNFGDVGRKRINVAAYNALKPGGIYAVVDHTRRHMQGLNDENRRRIDPVLAIKEIQEAGFILVDYSRLHYHPDDELRYEVGRKTVTGNTDRFTLKFMKPELKN